MIAIKKKKRKTHTHTNKVRTLDLCRRRRILYTPSCQFTCHTRNLVNNLTDNILCDNNGMEKTVSDRNEIHENVGKKIIN